MYSILSKSSRMYSVNLAAVIISVAPKMVLIPSSLNPLVPSNQAILLSSLKPKVAHHRIQHAPHPLHRNPRPLRHHRRKVRPAANEVAPLSRAGCVAQHLFAVGLPRLAYGIIDHTISQPFAQVANRAPEVARALIRLPVDGRYGVGVAAAVAARCLKFGLLHDLIQRLAANLRELARDFVDAELYAGIGDAEGDRCAVGTHYDSPFGASVTQNFLLIWSSLSRFGHVTCSKSTPGFPSIHSQSCALTIIPCCILLRT